MFPQPDKSSKIKPVKYFSVGYAAMDYNRFRMVKL